MKKRVVWKQGIILLLAGTLVFGMAACGSTDIGNIQKPTNVAPAETGKNDTTENTSPDLREAEIAETPTPEPSAPAETEEPVNIEISETVLLDEAGVKITAKSLDIDGFLGAEMKILIENNSGKNLTFQCRDSSVNGYMIDTMMSVDVADGKKSNDSITFSDSDMELAGISEIADMEFSFHIFDSNSWDTYLDTDLIQVKTSIADTFVYEFDDSGDLACDTNGFRVVIKGLAENSSFFGPRIVVYIENNGTQNATVQVRDVSINGFMVDAMFSCDVNTGKHAVDTITFLSSDMEKNGIENINDVELSFHIFSFDTWDTIADTEPLKITFE